MAETLESSGQYLPKDLRITSQPDAVDKNKFQLTATGLKISEAYVFQFQYVFPDGTLSDWSPGYSILTGAESVPTAPTGTSVEGGAGFIKVSLGTFPANALRVDVKIAGGIFGDGTKVADSFTAAGTKTIAAPGSAAPGLAYTVTLLTITPSKISGQTTNATTVYVTDPAATLVVDPSVTPSTPTVSSVLGAIQLAWNGKTSSGGNQPNGFVAAKVYVGTSAGFTPIDIGSPGANQVDVLNFGNGQNTLNIAVGTLVNGVAMTYNTDYYVKIKTTNGNVAQDSAAVLATGSPAQIGKAGSGDIISITADQITTGTISSQVVTVGSSSGKHVKLSGTGDPITIYGTGGTSDPLLSFSTNGAGQSVLSIKGSGSFSGDISAATGTLTNALNIGTPVSGVYPFSVNGSGYLRANSGKIGGWTIVGSTLESSIVGPNNSQIKLDPDSPIIALMQNGSNKVTISAASGIVGPSVVVQGESRTSFSLDPAGNVSLAGSIFADNGKVGGWTIGASTLTGSNITLSSSGSITNTGSIPGFFQTNVPATASLSSGYLNISLSESTIATLGSYSGLGSDGGVYVQNNTNKLTLSPVSVYLQAKTAENGVEPGGFYITHASGDYNVHFGFTGYNGTEYVRRIVWDHWQLAAQRDADNYANIYDTIGQSLRPLVVDSDGSMGLGYTQYFSTTQATTPSSGTGRNGDLYFSTA